MSQHVVAKCLGCSQSDRPGAKWVGWSRVDRLAKVGVCIRCVGRRDIAALERHFADCVAANRKRISKWRTVGQEVAS